MIERMSNLPTGVIGFKVNGTMHAEDYRDVMIPAVEEAAGAGEVRFLIVIPEFKGFTPARALARPQGGRRAPPRLEEDRARHRHRVDDPSRGNVRVDDTRSGQMLLDGGRARRHRVGLRVIDG